MLHKPKSFNYKSLIRSAARKIWMWSPMRREAIVKARVSGTPYKVKCATCSVTMRESVKPSLFAVDHIVPASEPANSILSFDDFFERLFQPASALQVLCNACHTKKTADENMSRTRRPIRRKRKSE
jgi:5-methylcytosine-specific restriction endonuclease McrA